ncbi:MAG: hypothetical protein LBD74_02650 [Spirochaetaceae bacterium]|jgi:hypothetical protein|nr:hypothetical protein [Spirochaetaceae bacterium]
MLYAPQMLLIGSAGQNAGKTTVASAVIQAWKAFPPDTPERLPLTALKITTVARQPGVCPRGGSGCGACTGITGDFVLEAEQGQSPNKDTATLLQAGADQVFWLRARTLSLKAAYIHFLTQIPPQGLIICESNSLREAVVPGCFIMLLKASEIKPSARRVQGFADMVLSAKDLPAALDSLVSRLQVMREADGAVRVRLAC